jgi:hypothetical protein
MAPSSRAATCYLRLITRGTEILVRHLLAERALDWALSPPTRSCVSSPTMAVTMSAWKGYPRRSYSSTAASSFCNGTRFR